MGRRLEEKNNNDLLEKQAETKGRLQLGVCYTDGYDIWVLDLAERREQ